MNRILVYGLSLIVVLGAAVSITAVSIPAFAQYLGGGGAQSATPEQIKECKNLGIPEITCTEQQILAKKRLLNAQQAGAYGSGTPMFSKGFGEMGAFVAVIGVIGLGVAAAFFAMSRKKKSETPVQ